MSELKQLYSMADYNDKSGMIFNTDCIEFMSNVVQGGGI